MLETTRVSSKSAGDSTENRTRQRPRYFPRQLITPEEMNLEAAYFRDRMRRHNRFLHGWGVVCGAKVCPVPSRGTAAEAGWDVPDAGRSHRESGHDECGACGDWEPWKVIVEPGYILGPHGDEIVVDKPVTVDLRRRCIAGPADAGCSSADPWCNDMVASRLDSPLFVAVRYEETMTRPVRIPATGCGCDDLDCDYSRWCDGYEICTLTECPDSHGMTPTDSNGLPGCPDLPAEPWVVLAAVDFDPETGCLRSIDNCSCRRLVRSHGWDWWQCADEAIEVRQGEVGEEAIKHVGGGYYEVEGFRGRIRSADRARMVARAVAEGRDPFDEVDAKWIYQ